MLQSKAFVKKTKKGKLQKVGNSSSYLNFHRSSKVELEAAAPVLVVLHSRWLLVEVQAEESYEVYVDIPTGVVK